MTDYFVDKLTNLLVTDNMDDYDKDILKYGITTVALNLPKTILLVIIAAKLKMIKPLVLIFMFYGTIRKYSRGAHAKTPLGCFIVGMANYLGMAYLSVFIKIPRKLYHLAYACYFFIFLKYAPSGTEANPVYKDQVKPLKIKSVATVVAFYFIGLKEGLLRNVAFLSLFSQAVSILPITYTLSGQKGGMVHEDE